MFLPIHSIREMFASFIAFECAVHINILYDFQPHSKKKKKNKKK